MTWLCRAVPNSFRASRERMAWPAGIMSDPGKPAAVRMWSNGSVAKDGQEQEQAAELGAEGPGTEVELADVGDVGGGRVVCRAVAPRRARRGRRAKPSSLRIWEMATGLRVMPSLARARLMS